ncbi:MAG: 2-phospho-L-lactate guanylyltransferase [Acidobacteria bacterium]|nr:2-phospho-L-lactate guanylyltransferase [Acidobacteriota bacterium]
MASYLSSEERAELVWAMLRDVTRALSNVTLADHIVVVTQDRLIIQYVSALGWKVISEQEQCSESQSVDTACRLLQQQGATAILRLPADIPLVESEDIDVLLHAKSDSPSAVLVPSQDRRGTNALYRMPPDALPSRFGSDSFFLHREEAGRCGVTLKVVDNPRISLDIDTPFDLLQLNEYGTHTEAFRVMQKMGVLDRLINLSREIPCDALNCI